MAKRLQRNTSNGLPAELNVRIRLNGRTGQWVAEKVVTKNGEVIVKGGPITGGEPRRVLRPSGETKLPAKNLRQLAGLMKLHD